jgi:peptidyl-tRNA hydrolase
MNLSGRALDSFLKKNSTVLKADILVMHDDLQHKFGNVRIKEKGSA